MPAVIFSRCGIYSDCLFWFSGNLRQSNNNNNTSQVFVVKSINFNIYGLVLSSKKANFLLMFIFLLPIRNQIPLNLFLELVRL